MLSILIPTYNSGKTIKNCLSSVLESCIYAKQRLENLEMEHFYICIHDDGSTDDTVHFCKEFYVQHYATMNVYKIYWSLFESEENKKRGYVRNRLVEKARYNKSKFGMWVDSDDEVDDRKIFFQIMAMMSSDIKYTHTSMRNLFDIEGNLINERNIAEYGDDANLINYAKDISTVTPQKNEVNGCTVMFDVETQVKFKYIEDDAYDGIEDMYMWIDVTNAGYPIVSVEPSEPLYNYKTKWKKKKRYVFRFDDVSSNQHPLGGCNDVAYAIKQIFPDAEIQYAISPLVFDLSENGNYPAKNETEAQRPFPKIFNAYSDFRCFFSTDKVGLFDFNKIPNFVVRKSHGLFHIDHRLLTKEQQEMSIIAGCSLVGSSLFTPPFNKYNNDTLQICKELNITLDNFNDGWRSMEHENWDENNKLWYLHPRYWNVQKIKDYFNKNET